MSEADPTAAVSVLREPRGVLPPGTRLRSYELLSVLGQGGFGITYRARDQTLGRNVAVKEYLPGLLAVREGGSTVVPRSTEVSDQFLWGRERFLEEARTLALFDRVPGIVRVYDFLQANGTAYMVMALAEGETLSQRLKREKVLKPPAIDRLLDPLLDGLQQVHAARFLHRDIKPANIMLDAEGNPTLIDFGASRAAVAEHSMVMTAIFTPGYAAAEQFTTAKQGPYTDIYGLSATLYHAITGQQPPSAFDRMLDDAYKPLSRLGPTGFSPGLIAGIDAGMAVRAADRPQSIAGWREFLGQAGAPRADDTRIKPQPLPPAPADADDKRASARRRLHAGWLMLGMAAAVASLAGAGYFMFASDRPRATDTAVHGDPAEESEQALVQRRQADAAATEKKRLEDEARRRADTDTKATQTADAELAKAQQQRQRIEEELARLKAATAEAEAKRGADEAAAKAQVERQRTDEEAARRKAEAEARLKSEADAKEKAEADVAAEKKSAEAAENALGLSMTDRQRLQVALTSLGFDARGSDGVFGPRSREVIAAWQKAHDQPSTGYLTGPQQQALLRAAAVAVGKYDEQQRKAAEEKKKADEEKRKADDSQKPPPPQTAARPAPTPAPPAAGQVEEKRITLLNKGGQNCDAQSSGAIRIYSNRIDMSFKGGWRSFAADADGTFGGNFQTVPMGPKLLVTGSLKDRFISIVNLGGRGCTWAGKF